MPRRQTSARPSFPAILDEKLHRLRSLLGPSPTATRPVHELSILWQKTHLFRAERGKLRCVRTLTHVPPGRVVGRGGQGRGRQTPHPTIRNRLRESLAVQYQQTAPCLLGVRLAVDARIRRTPAVHGRVYFDFRGQPRLGEGFLHHGLFGGGLHIVILRNCDQELRLGGRGLKMRTVRLSRSPARCRRGRRPRLRRGPARHKRYERPSPLPCNNPASPSCDSWQPRAAGPAIR